MNWHLESTTKIYSVKLDGIQYEVQVSETEQTEDIKAVFRADGRVISTEEYQIVKDFIYENILI